MATTSRFACIALVLAVSLVSCAPAPIADDGYELKFVDDFSGDSLSPLWTNPPYGGGLPATVGNGVMRLTATAQNDYRWAYVAATGPRLDTEPSYPFAQAWREGYFEARVRFTDSAWAWPAFWLFSVAKTEAWPGENCDFLTAEWDIMENGVGNTEGRQPASSWYVTVLHRNTTDNTEDGYCGQPDEMRIFRQEFPDTDLSDWHVWAGRWTADEVCTYLDQVEIQCTPTFDTTAQPMHMAFTMQYLRRCDGCPSRPPSLTLEVDWVRVWQAS